MKQSLMTYLAAALLSFVGGGNFCLLGNGGTGL